MGEKKEKKKEKKRRRKKKEEFVDHKIQDRIVSLCFRNEEITFLKELNW